MSLFGRLLGKTPPAMPAGARAFPDDLLEGHTFCVRYKAPGDPDPGTRIGPTFQTNSGARMYADWLNGESPLNWDINGKGAAV